MGFRAEYFCGNAAKAAVAVLIFLQLLHISSSSVNSIPSVRAALSDDCYSHKLKDWQYYHGSSTSSNSDSNGPEQNIPLRKNLLHSYQVDERCALHRTRKILGIPYGGAMSKEDTSDDDIGGDNESDDDDNEELALADEGDEGDALDSDDFKASEDDDTLEAESEEGEEGEEGEKGEEGEEDDDEADYDDDSDDESVSPRKRDNFKKKGNPSILETGANSLTTAAAAAFKLTKGGMKIAVDLVSAKHVSVGQIVGKWRMDQEVQISKGASIACPATLEFTEDGKVITTFEGKIFSSEFKFTERPWPRKCTIQFEATAYQGPRDKEPISMFYKGYFKKSIMNPNVVLIRGKVYKLMGKLFWKQQKKCGTFRATQKRYR